MLICLPSSGYVVRYLDSQLAELRVNFTGERGTDTYTRQQAPRRASTTNQARWTTSSSIYLKARRRWKYRSTSRSLRGRARTLSGCTRRCMWTADWYDLDRARSGSYRFGGRGRHLWRGRACQKSRRCSTYSRWFQQCARSGSGFHIRQTRSML